MAIEPDRNPGRYLRALFDDGVDAGLTDRELLERFAGQSGEGSEPAFVGLIERRSEEPIKPSSGLRERATIAISHDGRMLAAAQPDGWIRLWDRGGDMAIERATFRAHRGPVTGVLAFRPGDRTLLSGGGDQLVRAWDLSADRPKEKLRPEGPIGGLNGIAFSPDGNRLAAADSECIRLWDLNAANGPSSSARIPRASEYNLPLAFSPDGGTLYAGGDPWDIGRSEPRHRSDDPLLTGGMPHSLSLSADGRTLAVGSNVEEVRIWDMKDRELVLRLTLDGDDQWAPAVALSPDGAYLAIAGPAHSIRLWVLAGLEPRERDRIDGNGWPISSMAFSPDGRMLAAGTKGGTRPWSLSGGKLKEPHPRMEAGGRSTARPIDECLGFSMAFTPDGERLVAADHRADRGGRKPSRPAICVYDVATGERLHEWDMTVPCWAIALAPDGRHVAAARRDGIAMILRLPGTPR